MNDKNFPPSAQHLWDYFRGELTDQECRQLENQLEVDVNLRDELDRLRRLESAIGVVLDDTPNLSVSSSLRAQVQHRLNELIPPPVSTSSKSKPAVIVNKESAQVRRWHPGRLASVALSVLVLAGLAVALTWPQFAPTMTSRGVIQPTGEESSKRQNAGSGETQLGHDFTAPAIEDSKTNRFDDAKNMFLESELASQAPTLDSAVGELGHLQPNDGKAGTGDITMGRPVATMGRPVDRRVHVLAGKSGGNSTSGTANLAEGKDGSSRDRAIVTQFGGVAGGGVPGGTGGALGGMGGAIGSMDGFRSVGGDRGAMGGAGGMGGGALGGMGGIGGPGPGGGGAGRAKMANSGGYGVPAAKAASGPVAGGQPNANPEKYYLWHEQSIPSRPADHLSKNWTATPPSRRYAELDDGGVGQPVVAFNVRPTAKPGGDVRQLHGGQTDSYGTEQYDRIVENDFLTVNAENALSTFSVDVDSASYANVRRFLTSRTLPPPDAVRIEELVNYFHYDYAPPQDERPFATHMEVAACPWREGNQLVRIALKGREVPKAKRPNSSLVFLIDVSGSMSPNEKLPLLQQSLKMLVNELGESDTVSIVTYAGDAGLALDATNGTNKDKINGAIDCLRAGGSTHGSAGIQMAYAKAGEHFIKGGTNRVILATDGDLNVGVTSEDELVKLIKQKASSGVFLTVLGFGTGNLQDGKLEQLADNGNGMYAYIDTLREGHRVLVDQISGSLVTIAKDVKIQIEFNPAEVLAYRLIGYENRVMAAQDFHNDRKDAGDIGAGHTVTALYEIVPAKGESASPTGEKLRYQQVAGAPPAPLTDAAANGEMLTLKLRYKKPDEETSQLWEIPLKSTRKPFARSSRDFQFAASVAAFGMVLRGSRYAGQATLSGVQEVASIALGDDPKGQRSEFLDLVRRAQELGK